MLATKHDAPPVEVLQDDATAMARYGITKVPVDYFHFGGFRYSTLSDAIAEARRQQPADDVR